MRRMFPTFTAQNAEIVHRDYRMNYGDYKYIRQAIGWPAWRFDLAALAGPMAEVSCAQGLLTGCLADGSLLPFYSLSAQIQRERKTYYDIPKRTQKRSMSVAEWLAWFLDILHRIVPVNTPWPQGRHLGK